MPVSRRRLLAASMLTPFAGLISTQPEAAVGVEAGDVPTYRGNLARTGESPGPAPLESSPVRWWVRLGEVVSSSPAVVDGTVYIGSVSPTTLDGGALHAVDAVTGIERWRCPTVPGDGIFCSPSVESGRVIVGSYDGILLCVSADTGEEQWRVQTSGSFYTPSPSIAGGTVYIGNASGTFYAIDLETGEERWSFQSGTGDDWSFSTPAFADGVIYVLDLPSWVDDPDYLHAFDAASGEELWRFEPELGIYLHRLPMIADGHIHVLTLEGGLYVLDPLTGEVQSELDLGVTSASVPALVDGTLYIGTFDGELVAVSTASGEQVWRVMLEEGLSITSAPTVVGDQVFAGDASGIVHVVDRLTGEKLWDKRTFALISAPAITGGVLYVGGNNGILAAIGGAHLAPDRASDERASFRSLRLVP